MSNEVWDRLERPPVEERLKKARVIRDKMGIYGKGGQGREGHYDVSPVHTQGIYEWCFGMVWAEPTLDLKQKEMIVLSTMVAQDLPDELEWHCKSAMNVGLTKEQIIATIVQCSPYVGLPKTNHAIKAAVRAFKEVDEAKGKAAKKLTKAKGKAKKA
jgi:4-carboxymuconolactone decarboxylase